MKQGAKYAVLIFLVLCCIAQVQQSTQLWNYNQFRNVIGVMQIKDGASLTNVVIYGTNGVVIKENNYPLPWPALITNSSTVTWATNTDGSLYATAGSSINTNQYTTTNSFQNATNAIVGRLVAVEAYTNHYDELVITLYGGSGTIALGQTGYRTLKNNFQVHGWNIVCFPASSTLAVGIWVTNTIPTPANLITGGNLPGVTNTLSGSNTVAATWTYTNWLANDTVAFNVSSVTAATNATIVLYGRH